MEKVIEDALLECHYTFPDYGRGTKDLVVIAKIFMRHLSQAGLTAEEVQAGFDHHIRTARGKDARFPSPGDIITAVAPVTVYRFDYGPDGFGALYASDHPYVRRQRQLGQPVEQYATQIRAMDAHPLALEAATAPAMPDIGDDERPVITRGGSGFMRLPSGVN